MNLPRTALFAGLAGALAGCDQTSPDVFTLDDPFPSLEVGDVIPERYIVVFEEDQLGGQTSRAALARVAEDLGADDDALIYSNTILGFASDMSSKEADDLRAYDRVKYIEPDQVFGLSPMEGLKRGGNKPGGGNQPNQSTPYGTTRVNGGVSGAGLVACVIDSGVDLDHPDLNVNVDDSRTFMSGRDGKDADDGNGHGTHVAGTIAAIDNSIGSVGVAEGATIIAIKVLGRNGSGSTSGVIAGVDYAATAGCSVANMSLGGGVSTALDQAVLDAGRSVIMVLAAGNESDDANNHSPARAGGASSTDDVFAISAIDSNDHFASFSNYGSDVEFAAPGVAVYSTYKSGGYATLSGTSLAAPHAAGVMLLGNARTSGTAINDPDGNPDPIIVH